MSEGVDREEVGRLIAAYEQNRVRYLKEAARCKDVAGRFAEKIKRLRRVGTVEDPSKWRVGTVIRWDMESRVYREGATVARAAIKTEPDNWMLTGTGIELSDAQLRDHLQEDECRCVELLAGQRKIKGEL